jgi:hypothetical protein
LFGPGIAGKIVNYVDQSISKFNALGLKSEFAIPADKTRTNGNNPYLPNSKEFLKIMDKRGELTMNHNPGNNLRITFLRSIKFFTDSAKNKIMVLEFMMGRKVSFQVEIKMSNYGKKQFDINFQQMPFVPGNPQLTQELIRKKQFNGYKTSRSLSHFDKNQLEVDVCRMMYTALNQISIREFKISMSENLVKYGKTRRSYKNAIGCERDVIFRKRFTDTEMINVVQTYFSKLDKNTYGYMRAKLNTVTNKDIYEVNQEFDENNDNLNRQATQSKLDLFNDDSESAREESVESDIQESPQNTGLKRQNNTVKDIDLDSNKSEDVSQKSSSKIQRQNNMYDISKEDVYELRNRDVPKTFTNKSQSSSNSSVSEENSSPTIQKQLEQSHKSDDVTPYHWSERTPDDNSSVKEQLKNKSEDVTPYNWSERTPDTNLIKEKLKEEFINRLYENQDDESYKTALNEIQEEPVKKKRKRVIVLIETIECSKCKNDINTEIFLRLLNNKSFMI